MIELLFFRKEYTLNTPMFTLKKDINYLILQWQKHVQMSQSYLMNIKDQKMVSPGLYFESSIEKHEYCKWLIMHVGLS